MKTKSTLLGICLSTFLLLDCTSRDEITEIYEETLSSLSFIEHTLNLPKEPVTDVEMLKQYEQVMIEVLTMAKNKDFREFIFDEALLQVDGDYDIFIDKIVDAYKKDDGVKKSTSNLKLLSVNLKNANNGIRPIIFYPRAETLEKNLKVNKSFNVKSTIEEPVVVFRGAYNEDYSVPGFRLDEDNSLVFDRMVTEEDAWQNDVYIVGPEEDVDMPEEIDPVGDNPGDNTSATSDIRTDGRIEYGATIQVLDMNAIEHWFSGKFEFRLIVAGVAGSAATVIKDFKFTRARDNFKDKRWYTYGDNGVFLFYWNTSNLGQWNVEKWMELDGGKSTQTTITFPSQNGLPTTSVTVPSEDLDDDLGSSIVQFTDPLSTVYNISYMNFKRK